MRFQQYGMDLLHQNVMVRITYDTVRVMIVLMRIMSDTVRVIIVMMRIIFNMVCVTIVMIRTTSDIVRDMIVIVRIMSDTVPACHVSGMKRDPGTRHIRSKKKRWHLGNPNGELYV